ncbi:MAG TPA: glutamate-1-semialdehyde 2,1-aminomutase, partial [Phenylobacterium sp.]|nr:glutamate-1-semialdehyde 2,1-aminomutase [Phenylobacterium sp.]
EGEVLNALDELGFRQTGPVQMPLFLFDDDRDQRFGFAWCSHMLDQGVYMHPWHNMFLCAAMTDADIDLTLDAAERAFTQLRKEAPTLGPVPKMQFLVA